MSILYSRTVSSYIVTSVVVLPQEWWARMSALVSLPYRCVLAQTDFMFVKDMNKGGY